MGYGKRSGTAELIFRLCSMMLRRLFIILRNPGLDCLTLFMTVQRHDL